MKMNERRSLVYLAPLSAELYPGLLFVYSFLGGLPQRMTEVDARGFEFVASTFCLRPYTFQTLTYREPPPAALAHGGLRPPDGVGGVCRVRF